MPKRNIADLRPGHVIAVEQAVEDPPWQFSNPPGVEVVQKTVAVIDDLRGGVGTARWRVTFVDGSSVTFDHDRCWVAREPDPSFRLPDVEPEPSR